MKGKKTKTRRCEDEMRKPGAGARYLLQAWHVRSKLVLYCTVLYM